jgi:NADP-dependent 3-hydroxy acid dehydrogenase YdfG
MKAVVVTGGRSGTGRATAAAFADHGHHLVVTGRRTQRLKSTATELGPRVSWSAFDPTNPAEITDASINYRRASTRS